MGTSRGLMRFFSLTGLSTSKFSVKKIFRNFSAVVSLKDRSYRVQSPAPKSVLVKFLGVAGQWLYQASSVCNSVPTILFTKKFKITLLPENGCVNMTMRMQIGVTYFLLLACTMSSCIGTVISGM